MMNQVKSVVKMMKADQEKSEALIQYLYENQTIRSLVEHNMDFLEYVKLHCEMNGFAMEQVQESMVNFSLKQYEKYCEMTEAEKAEYDSAEKIYCKAKLVALAKELENEEHPELRMSLIISNVIDNIINDKYDAQDIDLIFTSDMWAMMLMALYVVIINKSRQAA